ncbi:cache domain-containing sensor histidine kinase [Sporosarcina sp. CAU 1771]
MKMFKSNVLKKLRVQIALHYLITSAIILFLMGFILYTSISSVVLKESVSTTEAAVEKSGMYIDLYIDRLKAVSSILAENPQLLAYLSNSERDPADKNDLSQTIDTIVASDSFIKSVVIVSKDGQLISNEENLTMSMSGDMMKEQWYTSAVHSGSMPVLTSARMQNFSMDKDSWVISISREIKDASGDNIGVLLIDIEYQVIEDYLTNLDLGKNGFFFIMNEQSQVVYHMDPSYFMDETKQSELINILANKEVYDREEGTHTQTTLLKNADWVLAGVSSQDSLLAVKNQLLEIFLLVGIVLQLIAALSVSIFAGRITAPFQKLEQAMQEIEDGLTHVPIDEKGCYEAQSLANHFNQMVQKIELLMQEIRENEKHLRSSEIKVLHSQINPHFLYNTLDTIVWMAEFNDSQKVIDITKSLAHFFRLSLSGGKELTTIENELDHVRQYLFIQKERYGDQLSYVIECEDHLHQIEVPKIILQPIVENALYHGIRGLSREGLIEINAKAIGADIVLTVKDNGEGFEDKDVDDVRQSTGMKLGGVGIKNVDERIKIYYGESYGITIDSINGKGTIVSIRIPQESKLSGR